MGKNKYGAKKITDPETGYVFDSKKEYRRWQELRLMEKAGQIQNLQRQVKYILIPAQYERYERYSKKTGKRLQDGVRCVEREVGYVADHVYQDGNGIIHVEDIKGYKGGGAYAVFTLKRKLMLHVHGIKIQEV